MPEDITQLIHDARAGAPGAHDRLVRLVYGELRELAHYQRRRHGQPETLNTTALVHEAYEKLSRRDDGWADRRHFFRVAARAMRDVLVDAARARNADKRGGSGTDLQLDEAWMHVPDAQADDIVALHEALHQLDHLSPRRAEVVELRYFVGLTIPEIAEVIEVSEPTVSRDWTAARAWLHRTLAAS
ncbi:MAG: sigma-70 family RNA polymerase sigma factor [Rubricoccaceae bacterium]